MFRIFIAYIFILICCSTKAQQLKGRVTTPDGNGVSYASVYIHECTLGIVANEQGYFQTNLKPGNYTIEASAIGCSPVLKSIIVSSGRNELQIQMAVKTQNLKEVVVYGSKEEPSLQIMRQTIAHAPIHKYQLQSYSAETYLKGSAKIESIPLLLKAVIKDPKIKSLIGKTLILESHNEINFVSPSSYKQRIVAIKSSLPKELEPKNGGLRIISGSIYNSYFSGTISPLSAEAFHYYNFKLKSVYSYANHTIYCIKVTPRLTHAPLFSGEIHIVDNDWSVCALNVSQTDNGVKTHYQIKYQEIEKDLYLPINYNFHSDITTFGVKGQAQFFSSIKYSKIVRKKDIQPTIGSLAKTTENNPELTSTKNQLNKIVQKEKLSTRDAVKMALLSEKILEPAEVKNRKKSLCINDSSDVNIRVDSNATTRDSAYWESVRCVPLQANEVESYKQRDTLPESKNISSTTNSISINLSGSPTNKINWLGSNSIQLGDSLRLRHNGLLHGIIREYNFVDGLWLGQRFSLVWNLPSQKSLVITPWFYYATARNTLYWNTEIQYNYWAVRNGQFNFNIGHSSVDIRGNNGSLRSLNSISSLLLGENFIRFYDSQRMQLDNRIDIANGLFLTTAFCYEQRKLMDNNTTFHLFGKSATPNAPDESYAANFPDNWITSIWSTLEFTPEYHYKMNNLRKEYIYSKYPTFCFTYKASVRMNGETEQAQYQIFKMGMNHQFKIDEWTKFSYNLQGGIFFNRTKMYAPDMNYYPTSPLKLSFNSLMNSFALLPNYTTGSTNWVESHFNWTSDYLALKRIPWFQKSSLNENFQINLLYEFNHSHPYSEFGYSLGFSNMLRVGVYSLFDRARFSTIDLRTSISLGLGRIF